LAELPQETGTKRLASLIDSLSDRDASYLDPPKIAARCELARHLLRHVLPLRRSLAEAERAIATSCRALL
jgi:hypothetical protein